MERWVFPPPPADYVDGGGKRKKKKKKKKKTTDGISSTIWFTPFTSMELARGIKVVEETMLRGWNLIPVTRYRPEDTWVEVVGRKARKATNAGVRPLVSLPPTQTRGTRTKMDATRLTSRAVVKPQKPPSSSAFTLTCPPGKYEAARASINPEDLAITKMHFKRAITGALTIEIPGDKDGQKTSALAERLTSLFKGNEEVKIARSIKTAELRVKNLDDSVTVEEVS